MSEISSEDTRPTSLGTMLTVCWGCSNCAGLLKRLGYF